MTNGFTREHFELLKRWGGHHYDGTDPAQLAAYRSLKRAYEVTEAWANTLRKRLFVLGTVEIRKATINQGQAFSPYTWAKIYPAQSSPKELAYTVGIDTDGFIVKIDTVGNPPIRAAYEALRGPSNKGSPFAAILPIQEGLALSFEQLVAWSAEAISDFSMGYAEVVERIGLGVPPLRLVTDETRSREAFSAWRKALLEGTARKGALYWLLEGGIVLRTRKSGRTADDDGMELGVDPTGRTWSVQINEPRIPGDHNSLSAIAVDPSGERFLLRQGMLRPNDPGGRTITAAEFQSFSGLAPVAVEAQGLAARRVWFRVCSLDVPPADICRATSRFVDNCAAARAAADAGEAPIGGPDSDMFGADEKGGTYKNRARPAQEERTIARRHGLVWLALAELLNEAGIRIRKGRHPLGYEVDAEIDGGKAPPLLVEIKTGISAGDIHAGVGQLHLYPKLIKRLSNHKLVLLLPGLPAPAVRAAVEKCGIAIHIFELDESESDSAKVRFSRGLLKCCGLADTA